jgi:hypothetical protein
MAQKPQRKEINITTGIFTANSVRGPSEKHLSNQIFMYEQQRSVYTGSPDILLHCSVHSTPRVQTVSLRTIIIVHILVFYI